MSEKRFYLEKLDGIRDAIKALPEDVSICAITEDYTQKNVMRVQILEHPEVKGERIRPLDDGEFWCEAKYAGITIGWIEEVKHDD